MEDDGMEYTVSESPVIPLLDGQWDAEVWRLAETGCIAHFRPESSEHIPGVEFRLLYTENRICGMFRVKDRFVRCVHEGFQAPVCRDSCVEFFCQPPVGEGYFNFEFSCGGSVLVSYVRDCRRTSTGFADFTMLTAEDVQELRVWHSMPVRVEPEIEEETELDHTPQGPPKWGLPPSKEDEERERLNAAGYGNLDTRKEPINVLRYQDRIGLTDQGIIDLIKPHVPGLGWRFPDGRLPKTVYGRKGTLKAMMLRLIREQKLSTDDVSSVLRHAARPEGFDNRAWSYVLRETVAEEYLAATKRTNGAAEVGHDPVIQRMLKRIEADEAEEARRAAQ